MPFCRDCGKEVEADWVACPFCGSSQNGQAPSSSHQKQKKKQEEEDVKQEAANRALANVIVIAIVLAILLYPRGILDITLLEQATADCSGWSELQLDGECAEWREEGISQVAITLLVGLILLAAINSKSSSNEKTNSQKSSNKGRKKSSHKRRVESFAMKKKRLEN